MLRITRDRPSAARAYLRLEGRLVGSWATIVELECSALLRGVATVGVDLSGVDVLDRSGVEALERLHRLGVEIRGCSDLVASILEGEGIPAARVSDEPEGRSS